MRGELDRGDDVSSGHLVYPSPAILRCTVRLSLDGRRTLRWRKLGFWMVAERVRHPLLGVTFFAQLREILTWRPVITRKEGAILNPYPSLH